MDNPAGERHSVSAPPWALPVDITSDPGWLYVETGFNLAREHEIESLQAVGNGYVGSRGALAEGSPLSAPATFVAGIFDQSSSLDTNPALVVVPDWMNLRGEIDGVELSLLDDDLAHNRRILDMRQGILWRDWIRTSPDGKKTRILGFRLCSLADRHVLYQTVLMTPLNYSGHLRVESHVDRRLHSKLRHGPELEPALSETADRQTKPGREPLTLALRTKATDLLVAFAARSRIVQEEASPIEAGAELTPTTLIEIAEFDVRQGKTYRLERLLTVHTSRDSETPIADASRHNEAISVRDARVLVEAHTAAWAERWACADIVIEGDEFLQLAARHAAYHLISACNPDDAGVSIAAKGLTGGGYRGHYFWDTDTFMVPFYTFTHPPSARALLTFRSRTLAAAKTKAASMGHAGALFAWESTTSGEEVTPLRALAPDGTIIPVVCGWQEQHISADVAYTVVQYHRMTGDDAFLVEHGAPILFETARFWADRFTEGADGRFHIEKVQGPDEYHEGVDDSAYTNWMAAENLRNALWAADYLASKAKRVQDAPPEEERARWRDMAGRFHTGLGKHGNLIEQHNGFLALDDIDVYDYGERVMPLDIILGRERTRHTQLVKQADVVMLTYLLWNRLTESQRSANFYYYEKRTGHGSSLSPSVHALVAARLGDMPMALRYLRQASQIDLANNMGNAAGGMHMAALGGLWQALVFGFGGVFTHAGGISLQPHVPEMWKRFAFSLLWRGTKVNFSYESDRSVTLRNDGNKAIPVWFGDSNTDRTAERAEEAMLEPGRSLRSLRQGTGAWSNWEETKA